MRLSHRSMALFVFLICCGDGLAGQDARVGTLDGAQYRIDVPAEWNQQLVLFVRGLEPAPGTFDRTAELKPSLRALVAQGFAVAQSGFSTGGWALGAALRDTEALRAHFTRTVGTPRRTYALGQSMGAFVVMMLLETAGDHYDGGLALCGPLAAPASFMRTDGFDLLVVFEHLSGGQLPSPAHVPADFTMDRAVVGRIAAFLKGHPDVATEMRRLSNHPTDELLANTLVFYTYVLGDIQRSAGGNPFDNRNTIYTGTSDDNALNDGVKRYAADRAAAKYLRDNYTPTGRLARPLLALHNTYDPIVSARVPNSYSALVDAAGSSGLFDQAYVKRPGHCAISAQEIGERFQQLQQRAESFGHQPQR